ncbi:MULTISPECIES: aldehyde dehydrogenase family protein [Prauserella salsuginis group]|uniref:Aldehyde dehydrogenase family protein n=1 Tax=Prauserella salsuginis TaxID=387889 RepID=A0ABW6G2N6_9PSEU|nr:MULTISPECIES: aldehyde dehydrogenase family protein [Prauserella salsuginis group]MCR3719757.1 Acyl-CoA reductase [Prauserella flava]MCR3736700.1 Acyl-CoA reductase [Prauserella salsuginis]
MNTAGSPDFDFDPDADDHDEAYTPRPREAWIAGRAEQSPDTTPVTHPADDTEVATVATPSPEQIARAVAAAVQLGRIDDEELRTGALQIAAGELEARHEELSELITAESGIPLRWAQQEVHDAVAVLQYAARHPLPRDGRVSSNGGVTTLIREIPRGPVLGVVSPEAPLRSAAHAVAAAFAVGSPVVVAAGTATPLSALALGEALGEVGMPEGAFSILPGAEPADGDLVRLETAAPPRGAAVVVTDLAGTADHAEIAERIAVAATRQGGMRPEAVRRAVVSSAVADALLPALTSAVEAQPTGNAYDTSVSVSPLPADVTEQTAAWLTDTVAAGATVLAGGTSGEPTLVTGTENEPAGGPVLAVTVADEPEEALAAVSAPGAAAPAVGLFTGDTALAMRAQAQLDAARVVVGDVPDYDPATVRITMHAITTPQLTTLT